MRQKALNIYETVKTSGPARISTGGGGRANKERGNNSYTLK